MSRNILHRKGGGSFLKYFLADPEKWYGSAGRGVPVPVSAVVEGDATIMGTRDHIMIEIDYSDFIEVFSSSWEIFPSLYV